jgi:deoxyribonuclease-4
MEKALFRARALGCSAMQIFSRNPRGWTAGSLSSSDVAAFREATARGDVDPVVIHTPYLLNLGSGDEALHRRSVQALAQDLQRSKQLGVRWVVTHLGSGKGRSQAFARKRVMQALKKVLERDLPVSLLLENSAGAGQAIGWSLEEIGEIIEGAGGDPRLGFCFDSCHAYAAGYDFRSAEQTRALVRKIDGTIGLKRLALVHLNDCSGLLGSHLDRHQHIGKGQIGLEGFRSLLGHPGLGRIPMILETPKKGPQDDLRNLSRIREIFRSLGRDL